MSTENTLHILIVDDQDAVHQAFRSIFAGKTPEDDPKYAEFAALEKKLFGDDARNVVLDDNEENNPQAAEMATKYLEQFTFELTHAHQGQEARELVFERAAKGLRYDVAFVDMRMPPGWNGMETVEAIRKIDPTLPVVICTAYSDITWDEIVERMGAKPAILFQKKPFLSKEIVQIAVEMSGKDEE